jgi:hypothetical protein
MQSALILGKMQMNLNSVCTLAVLPGESTMVLINMFGLGLKRYFAVLLTSMAYSF